MSSVNADDYSLINQSRESIIVQDITVYCDCGWSIHPLNNKKQPLFTGWQYKATTSVETFMQWVKAWPNANVGIVTGAVSNLLILDVDGLEGINSMKDLDLPDAPTVVTARGLHYYFKFPQALHNASTTRAGLFPGIDTRGRGGFIVAPPSIHETGHQYYWSRPLDGELPDAPSWLIQRLSPPVREAYKTPVIKNGRMSHYARTALMNEASAVASAPQGTRNTRLNQAAFSMGTLIAAGSIELGFVAEALARSALASGLIQSEIKKTLSSGLSAGMRHPREVSHG